MTKENFNEAARPFSKTPKRDYSSLQALARRRRVKGEPRPECSTTHEQKKEYARKQVTKTKERLQLGTGHKAPTFSEGDVIGSLQVTALTADNHIECVCTCGRPVTKTQETITNIDVCRHTTNGVYSQEFKSRQYYRDLYKSWVKMCQSAAAKNKSIYKPWQHFKKFVSDNLEKHKTGLVFLRVIPDTVDAEEHPGVYSWVTVGQARTVATLGLPVADTHRGKISLVALALKHKVRLGHISKQIREGATPEDVYVWLINTIEKRNRKAQDENDL